MAQENQDSNNKPQRARGVVKRFNNEKGFGFITCDDDSGDVFVHQTEIYCEGFRSLATTTAMEAAHTKHLDVQYSSYYISHFFLTHCTVMGHVL